VCRACKMAPIPTSELQLQNALPKHIVHLDHIIHHHTGPLRGSAGQFDVPQNVSKESYILGVVAKTLADPFTVTPHYNDYLYTRHFYQQVGRQFRDGMIQTCTVVQLVVKPRNGYLEVITAFPAH